MKISLLNQFCTNNSLFTILATASLLGGLSYANTADITLSYTNMVVENNTVTFTDTGEEIFYINEASSSTYFSSKGENDFTSTANINTESYSQSSAKSSVTIEGTLTVTDTFKKTGTSKLTVDVLDLSSITGSASFTRGYITIGTELKLGNTIFTNNITDSSQDAYIILNAGAKISTSSMTITNNTSDTLSNVIKMNSWSNGVISDGVLNYLAIGAVDIKANDLTLEGVSFTNTAIDTSNLTINGLTSSSGLNITDNSDTDTLSYTITALDGATVTMDGDLTINIDLTLEEYNNLLNTSGIEIVIGSNLSGSLSSDVELYFTYTDESGSSITNAYVGEGTAGDIADAGLSFSAAPIPEPSTASLSLLALSALLLRRRRQAA